MITFHIEFPIKTFVCRVQTCGFSFIKSVHRWFLQKTDSHDADKTSEVFWQNHRVAIYLLFRYATNWDKWIQKFPGFTFISVLTGEKEKIPKKNDLRALIGTMMVHMVRPVLSCWFAKFLKKIFRMLHKNSYVRRSHKSSYEKASRKQNWVTPSAS